MSQYEWPGEAERRRTEALKLMEDALRDDEEIKRVLGADERPKAPKTLDRDEVLKLLCGRFKLLAESVGPADYPRIEELAYLLLAMLYGGKAISLPLGRRVSLAELLIAQDDDRRPWQRGYVGTHYSTEVPIEDE